MKPKPFPVALLVAACVAGAYFLPAPSGGQTGEEIQTTQILNDVIEQQKTLTDNQAKIDAKLVTIGENVRQARLMAGRGK
ncbi:MAG TPA: hypothetical protein VGM54_19330 [Chthoniobacter sp.]|jgi:hypothetical protein